MSEAIPLAAASDPFIADGTASGPGQGTLRFVAHTGEALPIGWYALTGQVGCRSPTRMQLAGEPSKGSPIPLMMLESGEVPPLNVFRLAEPARSLTLQAMRPDVALPVDANLLLRPIGRLQALATMLSAHRQLGGWRQWHALVRCMTAAGIALVSGGVGGAARRLYAGYVDLVRLLECERTGDPPDCMVLRLRRSRAPGMPHRVGMEPAGQVVPEVAPVGQAWRATGGDPRFVSPRLERPLSPGWYRFRACIHALDGHVVGPCLYPDYGQGDSEGGLIPLGEPGLRGRMDVLVVLRQPVYALRFDPTMRSALFRLDSLRLERLGRLSAFAYMLSRIAGPDGRGHLRAQLAAAIRFLRELPRKGMSGATSELFRRYQDSNLHSQTSYASWVERYDSFSAMGRAALRQRAAAVVDGPLISIVVPVYQTPEHWLRKCLDSVLGQAYPHWELCLADDASPSPHVREVLAEYAARDSRIKLVHRERNGHISAASNNALELATGQYIGLLDHDDELRPNALLEVAEALQRRPGLKFIYSDEDKIDEQGRRFDPYFKPDWNPDLLRSQNYLCHFSVIETKLVRSVGGFRKGYEGSQDHDLFLRCTELCASSEIHHIPRVLYHWRAIAGSTALVRDAKDYAADAGARAVADHLIRIGADARVTQLPHGHFRVHWEVGPTPPKVSLIIPTRDRAELLQTCVESILEKTDYREYEIVVVDNQSSDPDALNYLKALEQTGGVKVLRYDAPFNYSEINNWAVDHCDGEVIGLLNNDLEVVSSGWLREMVGHALRPEIGAVGAMLYYPDGRIQHAGVILGIGGVANHAYLGMRRGYPGHGGRAKVTQEISAVTAACLVVRRETYKGVGGLDEALQVAFNDVDFCMRLRAAGFHNIWTPFAELYHHESASRGTEDTPEKAARFRSEVNYMEARWGESIYQDPAYNPNLTLFGTDFGFAFPPRTSRSLVD